MHTLDEEGHPCRVLAVRVQGLAGVVALIGRVHGREGQNAASYHSPRAHPVTWTSCSEHTVTP